MQFGINLGQPLTTRTPFSQVREKIDRRRRANHAFLILCPCLDILRSAVGRGDQFGKVDLFQQVLFAEHDSDVWPIKLVSRHDEEITIQGSHIDEGMRRIVDRIDKNLRANASCQGDRARLMSLMVPRAFEAAPIAISRVRFEIACSKASQSSWPVSGMSLTVLT